MCGGRPVVINSIERKIRKSARNEGLFYGLEQSSGETSVYVAPEDLLDTVTGKCQGPPKFLAQFAFKGFEVYPLLKTVAQDFLDLPERLDIFDSWNSKDNPPLVK
jgi:hypothetical protein